MREMNQLREWTGKCQRCMCEADVHIMSMFDVTLICIKCWECEKRDPAYANAAAAERSAVKDGDFNFKGIGYPDKK